MIHKRILAKEPPIFIIDNFISKRECQSIIESNKDQLLRAETRSGSDTYRNNYAKSLESESKHHSFILEKILFELNLSSEFFEPIQIQKYKKGQRYKEHFDARDISNTDELEKNFMQRKISLIIYLNEDFLGGETFFPKLDLIVNPKIGRLLFFENCFKESEFPHPFSSHEGKEIISGEKWILTLWSNETINKDKKNNTIKL